jgi:ribosomal 50S subunit-recycling heat shock protein
VREGDRIIRNVQEVVPGQTLSVQLGTGKFQVKVTQILD